MDLTYVSKQIGAQAVYPDYGEVVNSQNTTAKTASTFHAVSKFGNSTREDVLMKHREISGVFKLGFADSKPPACLIFCGIPQHVRSLAEDQSSAVLGDLFYYSILL